MSPGSFRRRTIPPRRNSANASSSIARCGSDGSGSGVRPVTTAVAPRRAAAHAHSNTTPRPPPENRNTSPRRIAQARRGGVERLAAERRDVAAAAESHLHALVPVLELAHDLARELVRVGERREVERLHDRTRRLLLQREREAELERAEHVPAPGPERPSSPPSEVIAAWIAGRSPPSTPRAARKRRARARTSGSPRCGRPR